MRLQDGDERDQKLSGCATAAVATSCPLPLRTACGVEGLALWQ